MPTAVNYEQPALVLLRRLAGIIRSTDDCIVNLSFMSTEQRICLELLRYIEPDPGDTRQLRVFPVPTQNSLADTIGVTRQTVSRIFSKLASNQAIKRHGKILYVRDHETLEKTALHGEKAT